MSRLFATGGLARVVLLGIGDDAAVLRGLRPRIVWTIDTSVESVHFDRRYLTLSEIGARAFHAAVSDLAAMGARPVAALSSLIVPAALGTRAVGAIGRGQADAARSLHCPVVGGNLSRGGELSVTTTAIGVAERPLTRAGARVGDEIWLMGDVGLAAAGLRFLAARPKVRLSGQRARRVADACLEAWRHPRALVRAGMRLSSRAHAVIDVSDGLAGDAAHVASASGVRVVIDEALVRRAMRPELLEAAALLHADALQLALYGGEDYALLATGPASLRPRDARRIGRIEAGHGVVIHAPDGRTRPAASGFDHFRGRTRRG